MPATGGSIESVTMNGRTFSVPADTDSGRKLGGFENEVSPNGDGTARIIKTRVSWMLADLAVAIDNANDDLEFLQGLADAATFFPTTVTYADGTIYQGSGMISGEVSASSTNATAALALAGEGKLTKQ